MSANPGVQLTTLRFTDRHSIFIRQMLNVKQFSRLISSLHSALASEQHWEPFLNLLSATTSAQTAFIIKRKPFMGLNEICAKGTVLSDAESTALYQRSKQIYETCYGRQDPYHMAFMRSPVQGAVQGELLIPPAMLKSTEMYNELLVPLDLEYMCLVPFISKAALHHQLCVWRPKSAGTFTSMESDWLTLLIPHLRTALKLERALRSKSQALARISATLDRVDQCAFLLDAHLSVVYINAAGYDLLRRGDLLAMQNRAIKARDISSEQRLQRALRSFGKQGLSSICNAEQTLDLHYPSGQPRSAYGLLAPVRGMSDSSSDAEDMLLLLIREPKPDSQRLRCELREKQGFTEAECDVASLLLKSHTLTQIADIRSSAIGTVRNQVKSIFSKTGTKRQAELIAFLSAQPR